MVPLIWPNSSAHLEAELSEAHWNVGYSEENLDPWDFIGVLKYVLQEIYFSLVFVGVKVWPP